MRRLKIDVVHGFLFDAEIASRLAAWMAGVSKVLGSERNSSHSYGQLKLLAYRWASGLMTACVANSAAGKRYNQETVGLPDDRYRVVYNGIDTGRFQPRTKRDASNTLELPPDLLVVGMVGSFKPQKNHLYILQTVAHLARRRMDFCLVLVGNTVFEGDADSEAYFVSIQEMIIYMGLSEVVRLAGPSNDGSVFNACDITVLPSLFEGTPNVALESLASGMPVIATDVADNRALIPGGEVGFIVGLDEVEKFADRIDMLLSDKALCESMSRRARQWIEDRFSVRTMVNNMATVYDGG